MRGERVGGEMYKEFFIFPEQAPNVYPKQYKIIIIIRIIIIIIIIKE